MGDFVNTRKCTFPSSLRFGKETSCWNGGLVTTTSVAVPAQVHELGRQREQLSLMPPSLLNLLLA